MTLKDGALAGELLSFNKGDNVYLLKDSTGAPTYTEGTNVPALAHTYTSTADAGSATVTTTGTVKQSGNDLVLNIDGVNYAFTLTSATTADSAPLLTLDNAAETKIDASDVTLKATAMRSRIPARNRWTASIPKTPRRPGLAPPPSRRRARWRRTARASC